MEDRNQLPPPPPIYPVTSDIPPESPYHYSPAPSKRTNRGILGGLAAAAAAAFAYGKYALLLLFKFPFLPPLVSLLVSFGVYPLFSAPWFPVPLATLLLVPALRHPTPPPPQSM